MLSCLGALLILEGAAPLKASEFLEKANNYLESLLFICELTNSESTPQALPASGCDWQIHHQ